VKRTLATAGDNTVLDGGSWFGAKPFERRTGEKKLTDIDFYRIRKPMRPEADDGPDEQ